MNDHLALRRNMTVMVVFLVVSSLQFTFALPCIGSPRVRCYSWGAHSRRQKRMGSIQRFRMNKIKSRARVTEQTTVTTIHMNLSGSDLLSLSLCSCCHYLFCNRSILTRFSFAYTNTPVSFRIRLNHSTVAKIIVALFFLFVCAIVRVFLSHLVIFRLVCVFVCMLL